MIDLPTGKALVAVEIKQGCYYCALVHTGECNLDSKPCVGYKRKDGKDVIFKLVDYPPKEAQE
jgi:pyruvate formate-lyase activating enzyme-like uncharacterized protein